MRFRWSWLILGVVVVMAAAGFSYPIYATSTPQKDVAFCLSCHVMARQGATYDTSFHHVRNNVASCSDCHTGSLYQKYRDGAHHLIANTLGQIPDQLALKESSKGVVAGQCYRCHAETSLHARTKHQKEENCLDCHKGHDPKAIDVTQLGQ